MIDEWDHSEEDIALAGEYVLGLLSGQERRAFESRLLEEPGLRALVAEWDERLVALTDGVAEVPPPAALQRRIENQLFRERRRARPVIWLGALTAGLAAVLTLVAYLGVAPLGPPDPTHHADIAAEDASLHVAATLNAETGAMELTRLAGDPRPGRSLELWLIAEGADEPISLGVLGEGETTSVELTPDQLARLENAVFAISDEPEGGSPTGLPTGDVLASGPVSAIAS